MSSPWVGLRLHYKDEEMKPPGGGVTCSAKMNRPGPPVDSAEGLLTGSGVLLESSVAREGSRVTLRPPSVCVAPHGVRQLLYLPSDSPEQL